MALDVGQQIKAQLAAAAALWFGGIGKMPSGISRSNATVEQKKKAKIVRLPRYSFMLLSQLRIEVRIEWSTFCDLKNKTQMAYSLISCAMNESESNDCYMAVRLTSA